MSNDAGTSVQMELTNIQKFNDCTDPDVNISNLRNIQGFILSELNWGVGIIGRPLIDRDHSNSPMKILIERQCY